MRDWNKYDKILFFLVLFLGFGNIGGALAPTRILAIVFLPQLIAKWKTCGFIRPLFSFFVIFYAFCLVSIVWTPDPGQGIKELVYYPIHFIYFFEIIVFSKYANNPLKSLSWGWAMMIFICSFIAIWELTTDQHLSFANEEGGELSNLGDTIVHHFNAIVTFHNRNSYVTILCFSFPWIVYLTMFENKKLIHIFILIFSIIMTIVVIMFNMSRGGLLAFIIMGAVYFLLSPKSVGKTIMYIFIGGVIGYILINYGSQVFAIMEARASGGGLTHDDARSAIWIVCMHLLVNSFFIGIGVGGITAALHAASNNIIASPHSLFFEFLVQYGVIFTIVILLFLFGLFKDTWKLSERNRRTVLLMSIITMPIYTIINSGYLLDTSLFALMGTIYVFIYIEKIKTIRPLHSLEPSKQ